MAEESLKRRSEQGIDNIIRKVFEHPSVQKFVVKQSIISGIFLACFLVGVMDITNSIKTALSLNWQADIVKGAFLTAVGAFYIVRKWRN